MADNSLNRILGGTPGQVILRLVFLSFVVGIILSALNLDPIDLIEMVFDFFHRLWDMGFEALGRLGSYLVIGAMVVVPLWLVSRLFSLGRRSGN